jgi:hypothetical protein
MGRRFLRLADGRERSLLPCDLPPDSFSPARRLPWEACRLGLALLLSPTPEGCGRTRRVGRPAQQSAPPPRASGVRPGSCDVGRGVP